MLVLVYIFAWFLFVSIGLRLVAVRDIGRNFANPGFLFVLTFGFGYFLLPVLSLTTGAYRYEHSYEMGAHVGAILYSFLFGCFAVLVYAALRGPVTYRLWQESSHVRAYRLSAFGSWFVVGLGLVMTAVGLSPFLNIIASIGLDSYASNRTVLSSGLGYYKLLAGSSHVAFLVILMTRLNGMSGKQSVLDGPLVVAFMLALMPGLVLVSRSMFLLPIVLWFVAWLIARKKGFLCGKHIVLMLLLAISILVVGLALGPVREKMMAGSPVAVGSCDVAERIVQSYGDQENIIWLVDNPQEFLFGKTILAALVGWVPRRFWEDKPLGGGPHLRNMVKPGSYDLRTGANLTSYTTGLPAEAFMNFGVAGFLFGGGVGVLLWILAKMLRMAVNPFLAAVLIVLFFRVNFLSYSELFGWASYIFSAILPAALMWVGISVIRGGSYRYL